MRLAVCLHDGFYGCGTGAGMQNWRFLQCLQMCRDLIGELYVLPVYVAHSSPEFDLSWHEKTRRFVDELLGVVLPIDNGTDGQRRYGEISEWQSASQSADDRLSEIGLCDLRVVSFDTPFAGLLSPLVRHRTVRHLHVPRSTALVHAPDNPQRLTWERQSYAFADGRTSWLGAISQSMRRHLEKEYGVSPESLIDAFDGVTRWEWDEEPESTLDGGDRPFMLCFGRAAPYKGQHILVEALGLLRDRGVPVPRAIIGAVTEGGDNPYADQLEQRCQELGVEAVIVRHFHLGLRGLIGHPALQIVVIPSLAEPFGRIPLECYSHPRFQGAVVASTAGGLAETVVQGETGLSSQPGSAASLAEALRQALTCSREDRLKLKERGRRLILRSYDYGTTVQRLVSGADTGQVLGSGLAELLTHAAR